MAITPNFGFPTPDDTDQVSDGAAAIRALGDAVDARVFIQQTDITELEDDKVAKAGDTMTGQLVAPNVALGVETAGSDTVALDFATGDGFVSRQVSTSTVTVTGVNYLPGRTKTIRFVGGGSVASLTVPSDWTFVGGAVGTEIGTAVTAVLTATAFGTTEASVVAAYAEEA